MAANLQDEHEHSTGGALCLEFTNTTSARRTDRPSEHLHSYGDLLAWAEGQGVLSPPLAAHLAIAGAEHAQEAAAALEQAIALREAIYYIFTAHAAGDAPDAADLARLNAALAAALPHRRLVAAAGGFTWQWEEDAADLAQMLWPVARSAADLLTSPDLNRVRECAGATCDWLFVDHSKNRSRRWCDMQECGNVEKVRRYRRRKSDGVTG
jgi:predicted RNA-binding Zn ribbon-like protein